MDPYTKPQNLPSETNNNLQTSKFYSQFLYKAFIVILCLLIIPLFPSQVPELVNQTVSTRSWELLHLLFVGVAVSYGLFSTRTVETVEKGNRVPKFDNAQSYVLKLLQVSSVFDEECETTLITNDVSKVQTWSNRYSRGEPVVVVANENSVVDECRGVSGSRIGEKPLFLPVRSLKFVELRDEDVSDISRSVGRSNSNLGWKRGLRNCSNCTKNGDSGRLSSSDFEGKIDGSGVLPSPIPWQSRSGRMELKEEVNGNNGYEGYTLTPSKKESGFSSIESRFTMTQSNKSSKPNTVSSSQSSELQAKNVEDLVRKKNVQKSSPPPPPPPPPMVSRKPPLVKSNPSSINNNMIYPEKEFRRRSSEQKDLHTNGSEDMLRRVNSAAEAKSRNHVDTTLMGKSVRTTRSGNSFGLSKKYQDNYEDENEGEACLMEKTGKKTVRFDQTLITPKKEFFDEVTVETDDESESEADDGTDQKLETGGGGEHKVVNDGTGPDVDKKADEFIAKFREQIRLQRIASMRRSSGQINENPPK